MLKYWGYSSFRPLQEDIITSVMSGKDTLSLLPTGGGKSICFQVPALAMEGVCIVITPLIALMKDQVENLRKKGIKAAAIFSGMHPDEIELAINQCVYGDLKFLYVSPERLETDLIKMNVGRMRVNLLAVDEAHCISQWGYDFRPSYLKLAAFRKLIPGIPVLALTATATEAVAADIQQKLEFRASNLFRQSFIRQNLIYVVQKEENKFERLLKVVRNLQGCGIVYMRSRKRTVEIAGFLKKNKISAGFYHAGLDRKSRDVSQNTWISGEMRVIVATNAFGMGIDKPDVRFVVHLDLPDSPEAYFQEAGRAGRDGKLSYAVLLYQEADIQDATSFTATRFPEIKVIRQVYQALGNFLQIPVGTGFDTTYPFDLNRFCNTYNLNTQSAYHSLRFLEKEGYIQVNELDDNDSRVLVKASKEDLYKFQVEKEKYDKFIKVILRSYSGLFTDFVRINEDEIARRAGITKEETEKYLLEIEKYNIITWIRRSSQPQITFLTGRFDAKDITLSPENYRNRKTEAEKRLKAVTDYVTNNRECRSVQLLEYFNEINYKRCGKCDVCIERNKIELSEMEFESIRGQVAELLTDKPATMNEIAQILHNINEDKVIKVVQWLLDNDIIIYSSRGKLSMKTLL